jgi:hypothetical protein
VDISLDMLRTGRSRLLPSGAARVVAGDLERLPFTDAAFDKAVCLNALHHVPSMKQALAEVSRVLRPHGVAVFSEPGKGHAEKPLSTAAMRDYGVREQDVLIADFMEWCHAAGFADVRIKPLSYTIPSLDLTMSQWRAWDALAARKRPWRALQKIARGVLEFFGLRKKDLLFEEALTLDVVRVLRNAIEDHPVLVAYKDRARLENQIFSAEVVILSGAKSADVLTLDVRVKNTSNQQWHAAEGARNFVRVGVQLLDKDLKLVDRDYHREPLPAGVAPGSACRVHIECPAPKMSGRYALKIDMVREAVAWFETSGSTPAVQIFE